MRTRRAPRPWARALALSILAAASPLRTLSQEAPDGSFLDSDGTRIHYMDWGSGEPVLLIHGLTLDIEIGWIQPGIAPALRDLGYRVVAFDSRGHGKSDRPHDPASYGPVEIDDAIRLLDHLRIDRVHLVGWSRGAFLANRLAVQHPDRVMTLTLGGWGESGDSEGAIPVTARDETAAILEAGDFHTLVRTVIPDGSATEIETWATLLAERNDHRALAAVVRSGSNWPRLERDQLQANETPALAIVGDEDFLSVEVEKMSSVMSALEVVILPGASHGTTLARPEFLTALLGFLRKHPQQTGELAEGELQGGQKR